MDVPQYLFRQVITLGKVLIGVIQFPAVRIEIRSFLVSCHRFPAIVPDRPVAQDFVVLGLPARGRCCLIKGVAHAGPVDGELFDAVEFRRRFDSQKV